MAFPEMQSGGSHFAASIDRLAAMDFFGALEMGAVAAPADRAAVRKAAEKHGLKIAVGVQPVILGEGIDLNSADTDARIAAVRRLTALIDRSAEMDAGAFVILSGKDPGDQNRGAAYLRLKDSVERLAEHSGRLGIDTVLEIFDRSVEKKALVGPAQEAADFADSVRIARAARPAFGLLYDMGHMPLLGETPHTALPILAPHLVEVHLGNCVLDPESPIYGDKHPRFGYPGGIAGVAELVAFLRELFAVGFLREEVDGDPRPWVGFEVRPQAGETTEDILANIQTTWEAAWRQL